MKYKLLSFIIILSLLFSFISVYAEGGNTNLGQAINNSAQDVLRALNDIKEVLVQKFLDMKNNWAIEYVAELFSRGAIAGYPDGTFKPNNPISRAEFTKILISSLGFENLTKTTNHWASGYITQAEEIKLIGKNELKNLDNVITRNEMAKMCANALDYLKEEHIANREDYKYQLRDFDKIPKEYQDFVLKSYTKGIITGYPDGTFKGNQGLTRAEASSVIIKVLNENERKMPEKPDNTKTTELTEEDIKRLQSYPLNPMCFSDPDEARKLYKGFDEYYKKEKEDCENIYKKQLWTPINYPPKELNGIEKNIKWFSSPRLIYEEYGGAYGIRGVVQKNENGKTYEADFEIMLINSTRGTYLADEKWDTELSSRLSQWKEVN